MKKIIDIVKDIFPFDYSVAGEGNDKSIKVFNKYLDFKIHSFSTGQMLNGWKIPSAIKVIRGTIADKKKIILDGKNFGLNIEVAKLISENVKIPIIISGGCSSVEDFINCFKQTEVQGIAAGNFFSFKDQNPLQTRSQISNAGINIRI